MNLPVSPKKAIDPDELRAAAARFSATQLAAQFGVGYERIRHELTALGLTAKTSRQGVSQTQPRTCLKCHNPFGSTGPGNRLCANCRKANASLGYCLGH